MATERASAGVSSIYFDGEHYDRRYADYQFDIPFWRELASRHGPRVLEVACGTGRVAIALAEDGADVVGVDVSPSMLHTASSKAKARDLSIRFVECDMRDMDLVESFGLVICPCSSLCHILSESDLELVFRRIANHLMPSGVFAFDVLNPRPDRIATFDASSRHRFSYEDPYGSGHVSVSGTQRFDHSSKVLIDDLIYSFGDGERLQHARRLSRLATNREIVAALNRVGLGVQSCFGDFECMPFTPHSNQQVFVCGLL